MAKNLRPGPAWIPAVVVEQLGPLSYLVEIEVHGLWRCHVDLLKEFVKSEQPPSTSTTPPFNDHRDAPSIVDEPSQEPEINMDFDPNLSPVANLSTIRDNLTSQVRVSYIIFSWGGGGG